MQGIEMLFLVEGIHDDKMEVKRQERGIEDRIESKRGKEEVTAMKYYRSHKGRLTLLTY
jgi:hypothetical protein